MTLFDKPLWTVGDFAKHLGTPHRTARTLLKRLDNELGGTLLIRSGTGNERRYTFCPATLAKAKPEFFERILSLEARISRLEDAHDESVEYRELMVSQIRKNSRDIARLESRSRT